MLVKRQICIREFFFLTKSRLMEELIYRNITRQKTRGARVKHKIVGNRGNRSVEGRGMGRGTRGIQHGTTGTFRKENREFEGGGFEVA